MRNADNAALELAEFWSMLNSHRFIPRLRLEATAALGFFPVYRGGAQGES